MSEFSDQTYSEILSVVKRVYEPIVEQQGGKLKIESNPNNYNATAFAYKYEKDWRLMIGALGKKEKLTTVSFLFIVCHELGHLLGGKPYAVRSTSVEARADSFAARCMDLIYRDNEHLFRHKKQKFQHCENAKLYGAETCNMISLGALQTMTWLDRNNEKPSFDKKDLTTVSVTKQSYPSLQCRLDIVRASLSGIYELPCWYKPLD